VTPSLSDISESHLLDGRVRCFQPRRGYRTAIDAVLLAAAVPAAAGDKVLDVGTGVGAAAFCLAARVPGARVTGFELQSAFAELARMGIAANGFADRVDIVSGDLLAPPAELGPDSFDHVMANPPYMPAGRGHPPPDPMKAAATVEGAAKLADWARFAAAMVKLGGSVTFVHRADRLDEVQRDFDGAGLGALRVLPVTPRAGEPPKRVIVRGRKGAKAATETEPPLVLHGDAPGVGSGRRPYTETVESILRDAGSLL
jgi:tRNA1(Val) A37 N6-methylase TrmN6